MNTRDLKSYTVVSAALVNQLLGSLTNFAFNLYLLHSMEPSNFGMFVIGFAIVMILVGFLQGFFITQYIVLAPGDDRARFAAQVYSSMVLVSVLAGAVVVAMAVPFEAMGGIGVISLSIGLSAIFFSLKEFHIRHAFSEGRGWRAVWINAVMAAALAVVLVAAMLADLTIGVDIAFAAYALVVAIAATYGHLASNLQLSGHTRADIFATLRKLGVGGKWAIATNVIFSLRNNAHVIVLAATLGPTAVARVNAARLFLTPPILLLPALSNVVLPQFAQALHAGGRAALSLSQRRAGTALLAVVLGYSLILLLAWPFLESLLVGEDYKGLFPLIAAWSAFAVILVLRSVVDWGAQAERRFATITKVSVWVALIALTTAWGLTLALGPMGAVLALVLAELTMATILLVNRFARS